jgi:hypothetical protein
MCGVRNGVWRYYAFGFERRIRELVIDTHVLLPPPILELYMCTHIKVQKGRSFDGTISSPFSYVLAD